MPVKNVLFLAVGLGCIFSVAACSGKPVSSTAPAPAAATNLPATGLKTTASQINTQVSTDITVSITAAGTEVAAHIPTIIIGLDAGFDPLTMTVTAGTIVNLENDDCCNPHMVNSNYPFATNIDPGLTGSVTFISPGKYTLWIDDNHSVVGTITVT